MMARARTLVFAVAGFVTVSVARAEPAEHATARNMEAQPKLAEPESLLAPPLARGTGRVTVTLRPFFNLLGPGWGTIGDFQIEYFLASAPFKVSAAVVPLATSIEPQAARTISHARVGGAFATQFMEVGLSAGSRLQGLGPGGYSLSSGLRMGAIDGLVGRVDLTFAIVRNYFTGATEVAFSNLLTTVEVPVHPAVALFVEGGLSMDAWLFAAVGVKHHLGPRGVPGTWSVRAGVGIVWVIDECLYQDPRPCENASWAAGPTIMVGVDRRF